MKTTPSFDQDQIESLENEQDKKRYEQIKNKILLKERKRKLGKFFLNDKEKMKHYKNLNKFDGKFIFANSSN